MKYTKKKGNQNKPQGRRQKFNTSTNKSLAVSDDSRQTRSDQITLRPETHAARAVFNTPEFLEAILLHLPTKSLARTVTVSKYCQQVILGSAELRRSLFLEPSLATEFVELDDEQELELTAPSLHITHEPGHSSRFIVKAHPALSALKHRAFILRMYARQGWLCPPRSTHSTSYATLQKIPPATLLFQPPPPRVKAWYRGYSFALEPQRGLTFGALAEGLQDLRDQCQKTIDKLVKRRPCTPRNRRRYVQAMGLLDGMSGQDRGVVGAGPGIFLVAEEVICDHFEYVRVEREGMNFTG